MAKQLFKNYSYQFDKNEKKILLSFCKSLLKQMSTDERFFSDVKSFNSIIEKLNSNDEEIKFTKDERTKLIIRLKENRDHLQKELKKAGFIRRWLLKSVYTQYSSLIENHFQN